MDEQIHFMHPLFPNWSGSPSFYLISMWFTLPTIYIVFHFNWISKSIECITQRSVCRQMAGKISVVPLPHVAIVQFSNIESISFVHILSRSSGRKNPFECVRLYLTYGKLFWKRNTLSGYGSDSSSGGWMEKKNSCTAASDWNVKSVDRKQFAAGMCIIPRNSITVQVFLLRLQKNKIKWTHFNK